MTKKNLIVIKMENQNDDEKQSEGARQTIISFDKLPRSANEIKKRLKYI